MNVKNTYAALLVLLAGCGGIDEGPLADDEGLDALEQGVTAIADGEYVIKAAHSGKCLDVLHSGTDDGVVVQQWDCNGTNAQKFRVSSVGDGFVKIENVNSNRAIDVKDVSTADGAPIQQWGYGGGANQQFEIFDAGSGEYGIRARHSGKVLDVTDVRTDSGAPIQQWTWFGTGNQRWRFEEVGGSRLVFSDEFDGPNGSAIDDSKWSVETGGGGWGNDELQHYTDRLDNVRQENGSLVITATPAGAGGYSCWYGACQYTSARVVSRGKFEFTYGRVEARIKIPRGQGIWPAFWMLGNDIDSARWPNCGEIDIMENIGSEPSTLHGSLHGPGYSGGNPLTGRTALPDGAPLSDAFHTYAVEWEPSAIRFYLDGNLYQTRTPADVPAGGAWVYDHPFFMLLNVAVGGKWPGSPSASTSFPQQMLVDYVRVYQR